MRRKINFYIKKEMKRARKQYKKEKKRCQALYPDWEDNEFNMLDTQFIWGYNRNRKVVPSFLSWDDAMVYYNRKTKLFYMTIDTGLYGMEKDEETARVELERLTKIKEAFGDFLVEKGLPLRANIFPFKNPALEAETLSQLYVKLCIMILGYTTDN